MPRLSAFPFVAFSSSLALLLFFSALLSAKAVKLSGRATGAGPLAKCKVRDKERERESFEKERPL